MSSFWFGFSIGIIAFVSLVLVINVVVAYWRDYP